MRRPFALALAAALAAALAPGGGRAQDPATDAAAARPADGGAARVVIVRTADVDPSAAATTVGAAEVRVTPAPAPAAATPFSGLRRTYPVFGVAVGGGFPDLADASLLFRPVPWFRLSAGPCWGYVSWGVQGGAVLAPWNGWATPTLSLQAGKLFGTNLQRFVKSDSQSAQNLKPLLGDLDYQYLAGDLGLELGSPRGLSFFFRLGLSVVWLEANGSATTTSGGSGGGGTSRVTVRDPSLTAWLPSLKLGLQYWF